ncbi:hypothetical protein [Marinomonas ostreistagni]|uniref:Uncharacterized protein n=1 Tax=Marinomonas ostreistagni TaxID=359209 RepID=A0ABS0Z7N5_9GAMM|nr:hypothetical protein [Marinomonas ostreistagni]MBJ7549671.1 hypothetical protein [Marinomonas ostreistagni]
MSDALIIWDARNCNEALQMFIEELRRELDRFSLSYKIVSLSDNSISGEMSIKPSMRSLLDLVYSEAPLHLITFGAKANALATLVSPTLRCKLHTNRLPSWLDQNTVPSTILRIARYIHKEVSWGDGGDLSDYFFPKAFSAASSRVLFLEEDCLTDKMQSHAKLHKLDFSVCSVQDFLPPSQLLLQKCGLLVLSAEMHNEHNIIEVANGYGMPVLLISPDNRHFGIREGENGWVVNDIQMPHYGNYLKNWQGMSQNTRDMIALYCRTTQSDQSGLRCYCASFGYPERLELKDFRLRG